ncbi:MAG: hypothetical protein DMG68_15785 [Acidobacteria bacterium]|jgi:hypothetical protein|nr:MAG: hypothetical protein DMG68_15785 [Acidobacteriota bacterium]
MNDLQTDRLEPTARVPEEQPQPLRPEPRRRRRPPAPRDAPQRDKQSEERDEPPHQVDRLA